MARVIHFEIPVDDADRARRFYETAFDWTLARAGEERYWLATAGAEQEAGIKGALIARSELHANPIVIIGVASLDDCLAQAQQAGAEVLLGKQAIPGVGYSAYLRDTEGNAIGIFQAADASAPA